MSPHHIRKLKRHFELAKLVYLTSRSTFVRVVGFGYPICPETGDRERSECALLENASYVDLEDAELQDFARLVHYDEHGMSVMI